MGGLAPPLVFLDIYLVEESKHMCAKTVNVDWARPTIPIF